MPNTELPSISNGDPEAQGPRVSRRRRVVEQSARLFGAVARPFQAFLRMEAASGVLLLLCAVGALFWANLHAESYRKAFEYPLVLGAGAMVVNFTVRTLINDGLMTLFFFVVGMEIKRELVMGELNTVGKATLPAIAALGGMVVPAAIFLALTWGDDAQRGWGIPMATDIAFCVGILTLLKGRVPRALVVFITALAIFDDIGGILVIALFYGHGLHVPSLLGAVAVVAALSAVSRSYVTNGLVYGGLGLLLWYALHHGGIHATIAGVLLGVMIPARPQRSSREVLRELAHHVSRLDLKPEDEELDGAEILMIEEELEDLQAPLHRFVHLLHPFVAFVIMPMFALANSGVSVTGVGFSTLALPAAAGTAAGLFVGKPLGISCLTLVAVKLGLAPLPGNASAVKLFGVSIVAGVGFTVALFIAALAYHDSPELLDQAKIGILIGSLASGIVGFLVLRLSRPQVEAS